ncbi:hypothetical protein AB0G64_09280 [Streptomyces longwoodensis]|uniref:hypothetical protein n=1 Tax=Streptomyces longwoodensis TaxID=68231 RepID=UPI0033ED1117
MTVYDTYTIVLGGAVGLLLILAGLADSLTDRRPRQRVRPKPGPPPLPPTRQRPTGIHVDMARARAVRAARHARPPQ